MAYTQFLYNQKQRLGVVVENKIIDVSDIVPGVRTLHQAITADILNDLSEAAKTGNHPQHPLNLPRLPLINNPGKIICVGVNYVAHRDEKGDKAIAYPTLFTRFSDTQTAHQSPLVIPAVSDCLDYEGELALIIGQRCRHVAEKDAMSMIAGLTCFNDASVRDYQRHSSQFTAGKNFPNTGAIGPNLVTLKEINDLPNCVLTTRLNGIIKQQAALSDMIFSIPALIHYITQFTALSPGDIICTGTPGGVGERRAPPEFMQAGDTVSVSIDQIGTLVNPITKASLNES